MLHCLSSVAVTFLAGKISLKLRGHHFQSNISTVDPLTTLYTQNGVSLYSQPADLHGSALPLDKPSFAMALLTITLVFLSLTFKPLLSKAHLHFMNLFLSPSVIPLVKTKPSAIQQLIQHTSYHFNHNICHNYKQKR